MESRHPLESARFVVAAVALLGALGCADEGPVETPLTPAPFVPQSPDQVLVALQNAYAGRDFELFSELISTEEGAAYEFHFPDPLPNGSTSWDAVEELRLHRSLFEPGGTIPGEPPGSPCVWRVRPHIVRESVDWTERTELYRSATNPEGLDPERWRASGATAHSDCLIETLTETDYRVLDRSEFVVIEDRTKPVGAVRKFMLFRWVDLDGTWKNIKAMCQ
jgi:hypothetical protein